jgi:multiple sugar transport system substrate-binding protein
LFVTGKVAMILDGEFYTQVTSNYGPKNLQWDNAPLPYPAAHPDLAGSGVDFGNPTMIIKGTKNPLAAFKVLEYMQSVQPLVAFANIVRNVPQINTALQSPNLTTDARFRRFIKWAQGPKITVFPVLPVSAAYMNDLVRYENLAVHGKMTAQAALNKVTSDMQTQLDAQANGL